MACKRKFKKFPKKPNNKASLNTMENFLKKCQDILKENKEIERHNKKCEEVRKKINNLKIR